MANELIQQIYAAGKVQDAAGNTYNVFPNSVHPSQGMRIYHNVTALKARRTLEIGMAYGLSTLHIAQAVQHNGGGIHIAIDPFQHRDYHGVGLANVQRAGLQEIVTHIEDKSYNTLPQLLAKGETFDFVYIDGMHLFDYALVDFFYTDLLLRVGGVIGFDDLWMPSQRKVLAFLLRNRRYELYNPAMLPGVAVQLKRRARNVVHAPLDAWAANGSYAMDKDDIVFVRKLADDDRDWRHYQAF